MVLNDPELQARRSRLRAAITAAGADTMLITTNVNIYYTSGIIFGGAVYISREGEALFFVRRPVGVEGGNVIYIRKFEDIPGHIRALGLEQPKIMLTENDSLSYNEYARLQAVFSGAELQNATPVIRGVRSVKSEYEIGLLLRSGKLHAEVYSRIPSLYRRGMTDIELSIEIEREFRLHGSLGIFRVFGQSMEIFMGSVIAGDNADAPSPYDFAMGGAGIDGSLPVGANGTLLGEGMSVMVDIGGNFTGYMTDMTRVFSMGELTDTAYRAHRTALDIQTIVEKTAKPGVEARELYDLAVDIAVKAGLGDYFMGHRQKAGFIGHGIGIEINEAPVLAPRSRDVLETGMVFALEPKFVIPGVGALGIENSFCVKDNGVEKITLCNEEIISLV